jgi:glyoxylase-like metal-dependent hydrolase (beta-lactamase superfamily II)
LLPDLFRWTDACNVYVLRDGEASVLIDLGDGSVLPALRDAGIKRVEWVLFTHHHREQCGGAARLDRAVTQTAGPELERALFEEPERFRKLDVSLGDAFTVHGASYVRPPVRGFKLDRGFKTMDVFTWRGREIWCLDTRGNSPGGMSYFLRQADGWIAFGGDVMLAGRRMHNWFDSEWDYGFAAGLYALHNAAARIEQFHPKLLLPSHGPEVREPAEELAAYRRKIRTAAELLIRGYELKTFAEADQDPVSTPTTVPHVWRISPHLYKFKGPDFWPNFSILIADSGRALVVDCGLLNEAFLDAAIAGMKERLGLKSIDVCVITHMHGDHMLQAPHLRQQHGTKLWTHQRVVDLAEHPERFDYCAMVQSYNKTLRNVTFDRTLRDGETFVWEGFSLTCDWMPGQTEFACCLHGMIDGKKVAFTGDNLFASAADPKQDGHEALVARNSATLEAGYQYAADYLHGLAPDLIVGGHCWVIDKPAALIERYRAWAGKMREALDDLTDEADYRLAFNPYQVQAYPYRTRLAAGETREVAIIVRNVLPQARTYRIAVDAGAGVEANPRVLEGRVPGDDQVITPLRLKAAADARPGVRIVSLDLTLDDRRIGPWFDLIVGIGG